jgi:hypothetical protein
VHSAPQGKACKGPESNLHVAKRDCCVIAFSVAGISDIHLEVVSGPTSKVGFVIVQAICEPVLRNAVSLHYTVVQRLGKMVFNRHSERKKESEKESSNQERPLLRIVYLLLTQSRFFPHRFRNNSNSISGVTVAGTNAGVSITPRTPSSSCPTVRPQMHQEYAVSTTSCTSIRPLRSHMPFSGIDEVRVFRCLQESKKRSADQPLVHPRGRLSTSSTTNPSGLPVLEGLPG